VETPLEREENPGGVQSKGKKNQKTGGIGLWNWAFDWGTEKRKERPFILISPKRMKAFRSTGKHRCSPHRTGVRKNT